MSTVVDRNLLFGVLALQADLITPTRFAEACAEWAAHKDRPLSDLLLQRGWISADDRTDLDRLLGHCQEIYQGGVTATFAGQVTPKAPDALRAAATTPYSDARGSPDLAPPVTERRGRYTVTHLHARGGIGQVWLAEDSDLGRAVALKELRPDHIGQGDVWSRFVEEARITGQLEHPGIVPVYELFKDAPDGTPFYTMRFVRGGTLRQASENFHRRLAAGEARPLELHSLLEAFVAVCNAIAYAHSRGVIHRDIKGSNVVLGDFGEVMVLDWGLAKLTGQHDESNLPVQSSAESAHDATRIGQVLGTPAYMSPEQAEGRLDAVDQRSDVYSLGAMLYEILTGRMPFDGNDPQQILERVKHAQPDRPRHHLSTVPPALEAVCLKALAKDPTARYASPTVLAEEVRHWMVGEPVTAYAEPWTVRTRRWMGRHRTLVTASAAALMVAVVSLAAATWLLAGANRETREARDQALAHKKDAEQQRDQAKANFKLARDTVEEYTIKVADDPRLKEKDLEGLRKDLLQSATKFFQKLTEQEGDTPQLRADLGRAHRDLAFLARGTGDMKTAVEQGEKSLAIFEELAADFPDDAHFVRELAVTNTDLGAMLRKVGNEERGLEMYRRAIYLLEESRDKDDEHAMGRQYLADAYSHLGYYLQEHDNDPLDVMSAFERAAALYEEVVARSPGDPTHAMHLATAYDNLGWRYRDVGDPRRARQFLDKAVAGFQAVVDKTSDAVRARSLLGRTYQDLAQLEFQLENRKEAYTAYQKAIDLHSQLVDAHPNVIDYQQFLAHELNNLGAAYIHNGEKKEGVAFLARARDVKEKLVARNRDVPEYRADLARELGNLSSFVDVPEAEEFVGRARRLLDELITQYPTIPQYKSDLANNFLHVARLRERTEEWNDAEAAFRDAIRTMSEVVARDPGKVEYQQRLASMYELSAEFYTRRKQLDQAAKSCQCARDVLEELANRHPDNTPVLIDLGRGLNQVADCQRARQDTKAALETYALAIRKLQAAVDRAPTNARALPQLSDAYMHLSALHLDNHQHEDALAASHKALELRERLSDIYPEVPLYRCWVARGERDLSFILDQTGNREGAALALQRSVDLLDKLVAADPTLEGPWRFELVESRAALGKAYVLTTQLDDAAAALGKALPLLDQLGDDAVADKAGSALMNAYLNLAEECRKAKLVDPGADAYRQAGELALKLLAAHPDDARALQIWIGSNSSRAGLYQRNGRSPEALEVMRVFSAALDKLDPALPGLRATRVNLAKNFTNVAKSLADDNRLDRAAEAYRLAVQLYKQLIAAGSGNLELEVDLATAYVNLANNERFNSKFDEAETAFALGLALWGKLEKDHPDADRFPLYLAATLNDHGALRISQKEFEDALAEFGKAEPRLESVIKNHKDPQLVKNARTFLRFTYMERPRALRPLKRYQEALADYDKALELTPEAERSEPRMGRAIVLAQSGDHAKAVAETEAVLGKNVEGGLLYDAACAFSLASSAAAHDTQLGDLERTKLAEKHAARAVEVLRRAQQAGFFKQPGEVQHMRNDTDLDALRTRDDYKKFQSDVE